jgi:hypothetical protein
MSGPWNIDEELPTMMTFDNASGVAGTDVELVTMEGGARGVRAEGSTRVSDNPIQEVG